MDFEAAFTQLKSAFAGVAKKLAVKEDTSAVYALVGKKPSPFPQHKGHPLEFGSVKIGKAYVSFHLMPLYMVEQKISPQLKKRMQGKTCFNFKSAPEPELLGELKQLAEAGFRSWSAKNWV
jgi:hypothetical protein